MHALVIFKQKKNLPRTSSKSSSPTWHGHLIDTLIRHLKLDDFFATERIPIASFRLISWEAQEGGLPELSNCIATGELTIRDVTRQIAFPAIVAPQADGSIKAHAAFDIDRTLWNVCYGSGELFERFCMHLCTPCHSGAVHCRAVKQVGFRWVCASHRLVLRLAHINPAGKLRS